MKRHSERVPDKNLRPLCGRPLFFWIMDALLASPYVSEVVIDTDSDEIAEVARSNFSATILMRPKRIRGDMVDISTLLDFELSETPGEFFLQSHSTNPLLTTATINSVIEAFAAPGDHDSLFTVTPLQTRLYWQDGTAINHDRSFVKRTQDLPPVMEENSCAYLFSRESFYKHRLRIGERPILYPMDRLEAVDIDDMADFAFAEFLMQRRLDGAA